MPQISELVRQMTQPRAGGELSVEQVAEELRVSPALVYKWGEDDERHHFPANLVAPLTQLTGDARLIEYLCRRCDGVFVELPRGCRDLDVARKMVGEFAHALDAFASATSADSEEGEHWSAGEFRTFEDAALGAIAAISAALGEAQADAGRVRKGRAATLAEAEAEVAGGGECGNVRSFRRN